MACPVAQPLIGLDNITHTHPFPRGLTRHTTLHITIPPASRSALSPSARLCALAQDTDSVTQQQVSQFVACSKYAPTDGLKTLKEDKRKMKGLSPVEKGRDYQR